MLVHLPRMEGHGQGTVDRLWLAMAQKPFALQLLRRLWISLRIFADH
jgi:hypothetical protein